MPSAFSLVRGRGRLLHRARLASWCRRCRQGWRPRIHGARWANDVEGTITAALFGRTKSRTTGRGERNRIHGCRQLTHRHSTRRHARFANAWKRRRFARGLGLLVFSRPFEFRGHHHVGASLATSMPSWWPRIRVGVRSPLLASPIKRGFQPHRPSCSSPGVRRSSRENQCSRGHADGRERWRQCLQVGSRSS